MWNGCPPDNIATLPGYEWLECGVCDHDWPFPTEIIDRIWNRDLPSGAVGRLKCPNCKSDKYVHLFMQMSEIA